MQHFLDKEGNIDFNKMMTSADQLMQVINKTAPMVKQLSPLLNFFKKK
ncbi:YppG family protein [Terrilactibacillus sp. S3-3]|nr:YppG family protein [Terrilactibacillus sp. S3-3]